MVQQVSLIDKKSHQEIKAAGDSDKINLSQKKSYCNTNQCLSRRGKGIQKGWRKSDYCFTGWENAHYCGFF